MASEYAKKLDELTEKAEKLRKQRQDLEEKKRYYEGRLARLGSGASGIRDLNEKKLAEVNKQLDPLAKQLRDIAVEHAKIGDAYGAQRGRAVPRLPEFPKPTQRTPAEQAARERDASIRRNQARLSRDRDSFDPAKAAPVDGDIAGRIIAAAESALGVGYKWGGNSLASGVDCSGLVQQAFKAAGYVLPRVSADQAKLGVQVATLAEAQPGDLLSWDNSNRNDGADHIAIYIGDGKMIEAYKTGEPIRVTDVREGARINRIIGHVEQSRGVRPPALGPNRDRRWAERVQSGATLPAPPTAAPNIGAGEGGFGDDLPEDATPEQVEAYILEHYPNVAGFLANPELKKILFNAADEGLTPEEVQARVRKSKYWAEQGQSGANYDLFISRDPTEAGRLTDRVKGFIADTFNQNGLPLDDETAGKVARNALRFGWIDLSGNVTDQDSLNEFMALTARTRGGELSGELGVSADALAQIAKQFFVPMTKPDVQEWVLKMLDGSESEESFTKYVSDLAKGRFIGDQGVLAAIDRGITPDQYFRPARNVIAETLELNPEEIDLFSNPRWSGALQVWDEKTKTMRSRTLSEQAQWARDQAEYAGTDSYRKQEASFTDGLLNLFGKKAS